MYCCLLWHTRRFAPHIYHTRTPGCSRRQPVADGTQPVAAGGSRSSATAAEPAFATAARVPSGFHPAPILRPMRPCPGGRRVPRLTRTSCSRADAVARPASRLVDVAAGLAIRRCSSTLRGA
jgi:hypothetical protein